MQTLELVSTRGTCFITPTLSLHHGQARSCVIRCLIISHTAATRCRQFQYVHAQQSHSAITILLAAILIACCCRLTLSCTMGPHSCVQLICRAQSVVCLPSHSRSVSATHMTGAWAYNKGLHHVMHAQYNKNHSEFHSTHIPCSRLFVR